MKDLELMERAAKAAGIEIERDGAAIFFYNEFQDVWAPLIDDGDALRLAIKLHMDVTVGMSVKVVCANENATTRIVIDYRAEGISAEEATRRAIVEAVAGMAIASNGG